MLLLVPATENQLVIRPAVRLRDMHVTLLKKKKEKDKEIS